MYSSKLNFESKNKPKCFGAELDKRDFHSNAVMGMAWKLLTNS